jgi:hypothetical protein
MAQFSAVAIFSEDIREEKSGQDTVVGTMPDNLNVTNAPPAPNLRALMPRLGIYVRVNFLNDEKPKEAAVKILNTDGSLITQGGWDQSVIDKAFDDAKTNQMPFVGFIFKVVVGPLPIASGGKITAIVMVDGSETIIGALNIIIPAPNVSPPPA